MSRKRAWLIVVSKTLNVSTVLGSLSTGPRHQPISQEKKDFIDKLLLEKISLAGIVRATGVSRRWLQYYVNKKLASVPRVIKVGKKKGRLIIKCDEM